MGEVALDIPHCALRITVRAERGYERRFFGALVPRAASRSVIFLGRGVPPRVRLTWAGVGA